jgi:hypothetical protein
MANIIDFEKEIKEAVSKEVYENVFIKTKLTDTEVYATANEIIDKFRCKPADYMEIHEDIALFPPCYVGQVRLICFAKALYAYSLDDNYINTSVDKYKLVILPFMKGNAISNPKHDDVIAILDDNVIIGLFYTDMRVKKVLHVGNTTVNLPVIKDKEMINKITSALTLLKLSNEM